MNQFECKSSEKTEIIRNEQEYSYILENEGEEVAQEDARAYVEKYQSAIDNIQAQLNSGKGTNSRASMRAAMRENEAKRDAWKALLKEETVEQAINTAGIFKTSYGKNRKEVYNRHTTAKQPTETVEASQDAEQSGTQATSSMNAPTTSSESKDTNIVPKKRSKKTNQQREKKPRLLKRYCKNHTKNKQKEKRKIRRLKNGLYIPIEETKTLGEKIQKSTGELDTENYRNIFLGCL